MTKTSEETAHIFQEYRVLLFSIAYRMLGEASAAEDIVQEAFVRWLQADEQAVESPRAYLTTVVVRLCIDQLRSARARREVYVGPWLPEPLATGQYPELVATAELAESLSFAFLLMLEKLSPRERAVLLLREVFDYEYSEIAAILGTNPASCRQLLHRAHQRLDGNERRFQVPRAQQERLTVQFLRATAEGDIESLLGLLTDEAIFIADGGGKVKAALKPIQGAKRVARGMLGALRKWFPPELQPLLSEVNGQPAIVGLAQGKAVGVVLLEPEGERIRRIYGVVNPEKLQRLAEGQLRFPSISH
ncbi:RNA polymerase sigma-70 factor [Thermogemmatispora tikiterensis]|uniref:RNA polymerase subunit sigma-70 n=1 Tax=Thermogemmatispora tikiterensis TaxID=1825093 RepID=A0A328VM43_9CHLR|nr:RNA polymerase sigma-70 factor [Thermogemmatispora tikiterensis]RAQ98497.1 RNA polymerase subunit sigma-70 [Thermogemmatispora tikiterensis]